MAGRIVRAPRGTAISCKSWQQEAALRMLMNNLDPDVAEDPANLIGEIFGRCQHKIVEDSGTGVFFLN